MDTNNDQVRTRICPVCRGTRRVYTRVGCPIDHRLDTCNLCNNTRYIYVPMQCQHCIQLNGYILLNDVRAYDPLIDG